MRRAAVAKYGPGTKVYIWHDGSGHILPPPPYREEENLYGFEHEFQLRRLLPSLGVMTLEEWQPGRYPADPRARADVPHEAAVTGRVTDIRICKLPYQDHPFVHGVRDGCDVWLTTGGQWTDVDGHPDASIPFEESSPEHSS